MTNMRFSGKWSEKPLSDLAVITMGQSPSSAFYNLLGEGSPLIQGNADIKDRKTIERVWTTQGNKRCNLGDLILTVRAPVGAVAVASKNACIGRGVCGLKPFGHSGFLFHALVYAEDQWQTLEQGSTFTAANSDQVGQFRLFVPDDKNEQGAIAEALSDVDGLIGALDALIAKKRAIKQAAMQQLLTGKTRLPGFSGEWETKQTGELIHLIPSGIYGLEKQTGQLIGMPVATTAHIDLNNRWNEKQMNIRYFTEGQVEHYSPLEGDLIVVKSSGSAASIQSGKVGYVSANKVRSFIFSNFLMLLRPTGCNAQFLFFQLTSGRIKQMLPQLVEASTYPNLRLNDYLEVQIPLPPEEEQRR